MESEVLARPNASVKVRPEDPPHVIVMSTFLIELAKGIHQSQDDKGTCVMYASQRIRSLLPTREVFEITIGVIASYQDDHETALLLVEHLEGRIPSSGMGLADDIMTILGVISTFSHAEQSETSLSSSRTERYHRIKEEIRSIIRMKNQERFCQVLASSYSQMYSLHGSW